jgi:hypothetical protein
MDQLAQNREEINPIKWINNLCRVSLSNSRSDLRSDFAGLCTLSNWHRQNAD